MSEDRWRVTLSFEVTVEALTAPIALRRAKRLIRSGKVPVGAAEAVKVDG